MADEKRSPEIRSDGTFVVDQPVELPEVLDILIVGGGPFGTAAAFRARELGLSALVVDYDDLMKRIRDYAKDKLILPDYGGGDQMRFPKGAELIESLMFDPIDKDRLCEVWKALYRKFSIAAQVGVELTGLEPENGSWRVAAWNHNIKKEVSYRARHVVLAFGRGVPRRFDIPGNVDGLAFGLTTADRYVGEPVCVIGGGTSAAEAVIAISNAKSQSNDPSSVFWSYRGEKMPKVSKALADVFFDAFVGNGNVRYLPQSEPTAVVEMGDAYFLSVRTSRVASQGRPTETTQLEFNKTFCIACIGEDIPEGLLGKMGMPLVTGGSANKKRIAVTPLLETQQPNVYLAGDVLSPAYFETPSFDADPSTFKEVKRRGNIKAALRDGVFVAEVIAQKLAGRKVIEVNLEFVEASARPKIVEPAVAAKPAAVPVMPTVPVAAAPQKTGGCRLVSILPTGVEANEFPLADSGVTTIGRRGASIIFPEDGSLSDIHATVERRKDGYYVRDEASAQGVFVEIGPTHTAMVPPRTLIRAGRQWVLLEAPRRLVHYGPRGEQIGRFEIGEGPIIVGRQSPNITIAPEDGSVSRRHFAVTAVSSGFTVKDLGSSNGTFIKVDQPFQLVHGDRLHVGQQVLQFVDQATVIEPEASVAFDTSIGRRERTPVPAPPPSAVGTPAKPGPPSPVAAAQAAASTDGPSVYFEGLKRLVPCAKGQTICEVAEAAGIKLEADCHRGSCGMDPIKVVSGREHLNAATGTEKGTLEDFCSLEPGPYRLACIARVNGPVVVEIVKQ